MALVARLPLLPTGALEVSDSLAIHDGGERIVNSIQRRLETLGETEIPTKVVGEMVMEHLADLDQVAFVRFASVYRDFREAKDFEAFVGKLGSDD